MSREQSTPAFRVRGWPWFTSTVALLILGLLLGYQALLAQLDQPYFKRWLNSFLSLPQGIVIDYRKLELAPLAGRLQLDGLTVTSPDTHRHHTPLLLELDHLSVHWSTRSFWEKEIRIEQIDAGILHLYDVVQEQGPSTWDLLGHQDHPASESPEPLSKAAKLNWLPCNVNLRAFSLADLILARTELRTDGNPLRRLELGGLRLAAESRLKPDEAAARVMVKSIGDNRPTRLTIRASDGHTGSLTDLQVAVTVHLSDSRSISFSAVADLLEQTIDPALTLSGRVVDIQGIVEFDSKAETTRLAVKRFDILQGAVSAEFTAEFSDHSPVPKLLGNVRAHLDPLLQMKTGFLPGWDGKKMNVSGRFTTDPEHQQAVNFEVTAQTGAVLWQQPDGQSLATEKLAIDLRGAVDPDHGAWFRLSAPVKHVTYRNGDGRIVDVTDLTVTVESDELSLDGRAPSSASGTISSTAIHIGDQQRSKQKAATQTRLRWTLQEFEQTGAPLPVSGRLTINGLVDELDLAVKAWIRDDEADVDITLKTGKLGALAQWIPELASQGVRLDRSSMHASVLGRYRNLGRADTLELRHTAAATITHLKVQRPGESFESPAIDLRADHHSLGASHDLTVEFDPGRARFNGITVEPRPRITASAQYTDTDINAHVDVSMKPAVALSLHGHFDRSSGLLTHRGRIAVDRAKPLSTWLPKQMQEQYPVDWSQVTASLEYQGRINGLLIMRDGHAVPELTDRPLNSLVAEQSIALDIHRVRFDDGTLMVDLPHSTLHATGSQRSGRITGSADLSAPHLKIVNNGEDMTLSSLAQHIDLSADSNPAEGDVELRIDCALQKIQQSYIPFYPISDVTISGRARVSRLETFVLDDFKLRNKGGGTRISLSKSLSRTGGPGASSPAGTTRQSLRELTLIGRLTQSLQELSQPAGGFQGRGMVTLPLTVYSSDGTVFNIAASVELDDVSVNLPGSGLQVDVMSGLVQLDETVEWDADDGFSVIHDSERNHFSANRYQDTQPFLANQSMFKIGQLRWQERTMGPIIGSMHVKNNVFALNKLKIQTEQGTFSGQVIFDYFPGAEQITVRGNVTGVRVGKSNQRLDGNLALVFVPATLELDGRVQILRLTREHLEDILDLLDPFREDPGLNRLRFALAFGYPKFARMELSQGLAALRVELAGIGEWLRIDEIRGIALGPFMARHVEPLMQPFRIAPGNRAAH